MTIPRPKGFSDHQHARLLQWLLNNHPDIKFKYFCDNARLQETGGLVFPEKSIFRVSIIVIHRMHNKSVFAC